MPRFRDGPEMCPSVRIADAEGVVGPHGRADYGCRQQLVEAAAGAAAGVARRAVVVEDYHPRR